MVGGSQTNHAHVDGCAVRNLNLAQSDSNRMQSGSKTDVEVTGFNLGEDLGLNAQTIQTGGASSDWKSTLYSAGPVNLQICLSSTRLLPKQGLCPLKYEE